jgi:hypothetical protein
VSRAKTIHDVRVVFGALIRIADQQTDRSAGSLTFEYSGEDLHFVCLPALGGMAGCTRLTTIQVTLKICYAKRQPWWTAIHDATNGRTVGLTERGHRKEFADTIT